MADEEFEDGAASVWVWIGLSVMACVSFWSQATVTEERLVPALNVIADYYNIPDDIAGATLMAAGASSPELFSSIVALFITHSSLGLGTIVGSEIFNQLIICAGAVFASKTGRVKLDRIVVAREIGFYGLAIVLLYWACSDTRVSEDDGEEYIYITFAKAMAMLSGYLLYVAVCANMQKILALLGGRRNEGSESTVGMTGYIELGDQRGAGSLSKMSIRLPKMPFMHNVTDEPVKNWAHTATIGTYISHSDDNEPLPPPQDEEAPDAVIAANKTGTKPQHSFLSKSIRTSMRKLGATDFAVHNDRPTELFSLYETRFNEYTQELECFLWQRNMFYTKAYFGAQAWHLSWFTITPTSLTSIPDRQDPTKHPMKYPKFTHMCIDEKRLIINIVNPIEGKRDYTLMAPSKIVFDKVVSALEVQMKNNAKLLDAVPESDTSPPPPTPPSEEDYHDADVHVGLIEFPTGGSNIQILAFLFLYPLRFLLHYTLPDVRQLDIHGDLIYTGPRRLYHAMGSTFMCIVWLIIGSYAMVCSLESLSELLHIPEAVVGFTISAAGTSLPNYVASRVAAKKGFGNQAVSNAFGSNTFNIMVGLGLPWALYTSFGTKFEPYNGLRNEGIVESILTLAAVLLLFVVLMLTTSFAVMRWHGYLFVTLYIAFVCFTIGKVYYGE